MPGGLSAFILEGRAVDAILVFMAFEAVVLVALRRGYKEVAGLLVPGAFLVLALRAALAHTPAAVIALLLLAALVAHLAELARRGWLRGAGTRIARH